METKKITLPEGWEVDKVENGEIYLKETKKRLPNTWEEYEAMYDKGEYRSKSYKYVDAFSALHKLIQLRDCYRQGWLPLPKEEKIYAVCWDHERDYIVSDTFYSYYNRVLSFQTEEIRDQFIENFRDLIELAKELI